MDTSSQSAGNFRKRILIPGDIGIKDFYNPWNFFTVMNQEDKELNEWLMENRFIVRTMPCIKTQQGCTGTMKSSQRTSRSSGATLRCNKNRNHEIALRTFSFFEGSKLCIQDVFMFLRCYLDGMSLNQTSIFAGVHYKSTGVDWASFIRELFKEHFHRNTKHKILRGEIEIDESLFGRRVKYNRGNPNKGLKVWVFGMVERKSNTIILYPVESRSNATLIPLIERHVEKGSTIYSDGWTAYCQLNDLGYNHFTVLHKYAFKKEYKNLQTGEVVSVNTNRIEGAWKHAKDYFRKMSGTQASQWEGHLAEIMWRSEAKARRYEAFFDLLRTVYDLEGPPQYHYTTPLFDSWPGPVLNNIGDWTVEPNISSSGSQESSGSEDDEQVSSARHPTLSSKSDSSSRNNVVLISNSDEDLITPGQRQKSARPKIKPATAALLSELFSDSSSDECAEILQPTAPALSKSADGNVASCSNAEASTSGARPKQGMFRKKTKTDNVCHPSGFAPTTFEGRKRSSAQKKQANPYSRSKSNYLMWSSSDDDFQC